MFFGIVFARKRMKRPNPKDFGMPLETNKLRRHNDSFLIFVEYKIRALHDGVSQLLTATHARSIKGDGDWIVKMRRKPRRAINALVVINLL